MANLYVLEGMGETHANVHRRRVRIHRGNRHARQASAAVPGIVDGSEFLGSLFSKVRNVAKSAGKLAVAPVTMSYTATKSAAKATMNVAKKPTLSNLMKVVTAPTQRVANETKSTVKEAAHGVAESARGTKVALDIARRVAKRVIKMVAKKVLFHGDGLLGSGVAAVPKNAAKGILIPVATAAVVANTTTAPAAPVVPVLVNEVIDELYNAISKKIAQGLSPDKAAAEAKSELDKLEPGEENDPKVGSGMMVPLLVGGGILAAILLFKKKKK